MSAAPTIDPTDRRDALATRLFDARLDVARAPDRLPRGATRAVPGARRRRAGHGARRSPNGRGSRRATPASGSSSRRWRASSTSTTRPRRRTSGATCCRPATTRCCSTRRACAYGAGIIRFPVGSAQRMPDLLEAFRTGGGVDWALYGPDVIESQEAANRPQFEHLVGRLDRRPPGHRGAPPRRDRAGRRRRLRDGLVVDLDRPALPGRPRRRHRRRRGLDRPGARRTRPPPACRPGRRS